MSKRRAAISNVSVMRSLESISSDQQKNYHFKSMQNEFLKHCLIKGLSKETVKFYDKELKQTMKSLIEMEVSIKDIRKIKSGHIERFIEYQQGLGRAINTINSRLRAGRTFFNFCLRKDYINSNPYEGIQQLRKRHEVGATFTKRQLKKLLDAPDLTTFIGLRDLTIMLTLAHTGIRLTELTSLRVQDVSFDGKGAINVQHAKNRYARRIPLTSRLKTVLRSYLQERGVLDIDSLFISIENQPFGGRGVQGRLKQYGEQTGVSKEVTVSPHAFRRTFCRLKVEAGTNLFILQRLTGHQSLEILRRYVEIYGKDLEKAIEDGIEDI